MVSISVLHLHLVFWPPITDSPRRACGLSGGTLRGGGAARGDQQVQGQEEAQVTRGSERMGSF